MLKRLSQNSIETTPGCHARYEHLWLIPITGHALQEQACLREGVMSRAAPFISLFPFIVLVQAPDHLMGDPCHMSLSIALYCSLLFYCPIVPAPAPYCTLLYPSLCPMHSSPCIAPFSRAPLAVYIPLLYPVCTLDCPSGIHTLLPHWSLCLSLGLSLARDSSGALSSPSP